MKKAIVLIIVLSGLLSSCEKKNEEIERIGNQSFLIIGDEKATITSYNEIIYNSSDYYSYYTFDFDIDLDGTFDFSFISAGSSTHCWIGIDLYFEGHDSCQILVKDTISPYTKPLPMSFGDSIEYSNTAKRDFIKVLSRGEMMCDGFNNKEVKTVSSSFTDGLNDYLGVIFKKEDYNYLCWVKLSSSYNANVDVLKLLEIGYIKTSYTE